MHRAARRLAAGPRVLPLVRLSWRLIDQWNPELYEDNHPIHIAPQPGYHLSSDLVDKTISQIRDHVTSSDNRPFFSYLAFGACHWPHQVPADYIQKYKGRYDQGWDAVRAERFARQKATGVVPQNAEMAPRNPGIGAWEDLSEDMRRLGCRLQETYAAFLDHTDARSAAWWIICGPSDSWTTR